MQLEQTTTNETPPTLLSSLKLEDWGLAWLTSKYGISAEDIAYIYTADRDQIIALLGRQDITSAGLVIHYPNAPEIFRVRLYEPLTQADGSTAKYLSPAGMRNALFVPSGADVTAEELIITEGELKSIRAVQDGLNVASLPGIWGWRTGNSGLVDKLPDDDALIPELNRDWTGQTVYLLYDSDITPTHKGRPAFSRLAEQLYRLGACNVIIGNVPATSGGVS